MGSEYNTCVFFYVLVENYSVKKNSTLYHIFTIDYTIFIVKIVVYSDVCTVQ